MSFLGQLFGIYPDPTKNWALDENTTVPDVDLTQWKFGQMRFGEDFTAAEFLGRPGQCRRVKGGVSKLVYPHRGLELGYEGSQFTYLTFYISPTKSDPPGMSFSQPRFTNGLQLTPETTRETIMQRFGKPESEDRDDDWRTMVYDFNGLVVEIALNNDDQVTTCEIYPDE